MGARRNFSRGGGGKTTGSLKSLTRFRRAVHEIAVLAIWYNLLRVTKARAKILGYFVGRQHMTSIFRSAPPAGAHARDPLKGLTRGYRHLLVL